MIGNIVIGLLFAGGLGLVIWFLWRAPRVTEGDLKHFRDEATQRRLYGERRDDLD